MTNTSNPWVHIIATLTMALCSLIVVGSLCFVVIVEHDGETTREIVSALVWITGFCVAALAAILGVLPAVLSKFGAAVPTGIPGMLPAAGTVPASNAATTEQAAAPAA